MFVAGCAQTKRRQKCRSMAAYSPVNLYPNILEAIGSMMWRSSPIAGIAASGFKGAA
jgi:hypothetical protein